MPRVFKALEIEKEDKEIKRDYLDRHMPHVICPDTVKRGEKFEIKVKSIRTLTKPIILSALYSFGTVRPYLRKPDIRRE